MAINSSKKSSIHAEFQVLPLEQLQRGQYQPRQEFDANSLQELARSLETHGLLQPIIVRSIDSHRYEIVAGERRWRAAQLAGWKEISCLIHRFSDEQTAEAATVENIIRVNLNPIEEAKAYQRLIDEFGYIHDEVAIAIGKSRAKVTNTLRLLKLSPEVQQYIMDGKLSEGHGKSLVGIPVFEQQILAKKCLVRQWSVRKLEGEVKKIMEALEGKKTLKKDVNLTHLEKVISEAIGCRTSIHCEKNQGSLQIEFSNLDILDGLLKKLHIDINQLKE